MGDIAGIGKAIADHWVPIFEEREVGEEQAAYFLSSVPEGAGAGAWA